MTATVLPTPDLLVAPGPDARVTATGKPRPELREELRRIPTLANVMNFVVLYAVTIGVFVLAGWSHNVFVWIAAFFVMGPIHARFAILMHEAAHRLLFPKSLLREAQCVRN